MSDLYQELPSLQMPEIYSAIALVFQGDINESDIIDSLQSIGITEYKVVKPKMRDEMIFKVAIVNYKKLWELNDALLESFSCIEANLEDLISLVNQYHATVYVDIAFICSDTYPVLFFSNKVLDLIHKLDAEISIDPYK